MIRQAEAEHGGSKPGDALAKTDVLGGVRIPVRQHHHGPALRVAARENTGVNGVVFAMQRRVGRGEGEPVS